MPETVEKADSEGRLNALDPELPFLASQAAIELDNLLLGRSVKLDAVNCLAERLENSIEQDSGAGDRRLLMDSATVSAVSVALAESGASNLRTLDDLASEAWQIADDLQNSNDDGSDEAKVSRLRTFCTSLARSAVARERAFYDMQSVNNHWS